jgi:hypothetical protein
LSCVRSNQAIVYCQRSRAVDTRSL